MRSSEEDLIYQHMLGILVLLGQTDMNCERLRIIAASEENPIKRAGLTQMAELSANRLAMIATEAIELGRALAVRAQANTQVPSEIPAFIKNVDESSYQGAEGMPKGADPELLGYMSSKPNDGKAN